MQQTRTGTVRRGRRRIAAAVAATVTGALALTGCATSAADDGDGRTIIRYWMWDSSQMPGYQQCATDFQDANPDIEIQIEQYGWDDYWMQMTASMVAENAPDVFVNHTSQFGKYVQLGQIYDLEPYIEASGHDMEQFQDGLTDLWTGPDGTGQYGMPKDWDTVGLFYNVDMLAEAGYEPEDLWDLEWNPEDGGTFEQFLARMTVDRNGVRGDEEGFDPRRVAVYGLGYNESGGGYGQVQWAPFALSNDWVWADENPWGSEFNFDQPAFTEAITWWRSLIEKGYMPPLAAATSGVGTNESLGAGAYAAIFEGVWNARTLSEMQGVTVQVAPTPVGPSGLRASVFNGLADAIWSGTPHPDEAWRWVSYLGSAACQDVMAESARIFPANATSSERAVEVFTERGIEAEAFAVHVADGGAVPTPVTDRWAEINTIMQPAMDAVMAFQAEPDSLVGANRRVNALFQDD